MPRSKRYLVLRIDSLKALILPFDLQSVDMVVRQLHLVQQNLVYRLELGLLLLSRLHVVSHSSDTLLLKLTTKCLENSGYRVTQINSSAPHRILDGMIKVLFGPQKHEEQLKIILINRVMQTRKVELAALLIKIKHGVLLFVFISPDLPIVM